MGVSRSLVGVRRGELQGWRLHVPGGRYFAHVSKMPPDQSPDNFFFVGDFWLVFIFIILSWTR